MSAQNNIEDKKMKSLDVLVCIPAYNAESTISEAVKRCQKFADLVLVNLNDPWKVKKENILYKCGWSPFEGEIFNAKITHTLINGHIAYQYGNFNESKNGMRLTFDR